MSLEQLLAQLLQSITELTAVNKQLLAQLQQSATPMTRAPEVAASPAPEPERKAPAKPRGPGKPPAKQEVAAAAEPAAEEQTGGEVYTHEKLNTMAVKVFNHLGDREPINKAIIALGHRGIKLMPVEDLAKLAESLRALVPAEVLK